MSQPLNYKEDAKKPFNLAEVALFITYLFKVLFIDIPVCRNELVIFKHSDFLDRHNSSFRCTDSSCSLLLATFWIHTLYVLEHMHHSNNTFIITCLVSHGWVLNHTNVLCRLLCFGTRFLNWFQIFFQFYLIVNMWLQLNRTLRTKSRRLLTRDAQTDTTGILISLCALLEWGLFS